MNSSAGIAAELCIFLVVAIAAVVAVATHRAARVHASARRRDAFDSPDGDVRRAYARTYANQYTPHVKGALIRSPSPRD